MGVGPVCWTSLPTGLSEWELGPRHVEWSPIILVLGFKVVLLPEVVIILTFPFGMRDGA